MHPETSKTNAFNEVYYSTHGKLHAVILNLCKDRDLVHDLLQKVYVKLWEKWESLEDKTNLYPLLFTYAKNFFIDELRRDASRRQAMNIKVQANINAESPSGETFYQRKEYCTYLSKAMVKLSSRKREVVKLYLEEGLTRKHLAEKLSLSPNTVDNHLQDSLKFLRQELKLYRDTGID